MTMTDPKPPLFTTRRSGLDNGTKRRARLSSNVGLHSVAPICGGNAGCLSLRQTSGAGV